VFYHLSHAPSPKKKFYALFWLLAKAIISPERKWKEALNSGASQTYWDGFRTEAWEKIKFL
jgi:hypothetical protein